MANAEHLQRLGQGIELWNRWRGASAELEVDLNYVDLRSHTLTGADLHCAQLIGACLSEADLQSADLSGACLRRAYLDGADLTEANLTGAQLTSAMLPKSSLRHAALGTADLNGALLVGADLSGADLSNASLRFANLSGTDLSDALLFGSVLSFCDLTRARLIRAQIVNTNLSGARLHGAIVNLAAMSGVILAGVDLREVEGLETVNHKGPSGLSFSTVLMSEGKIPDKFLRGCGLREWEIKAVELYRPELSTEQVIELSYKVVELRTNPLIQFNSCFISYSSDDRDFVEILYSDLQKSGVRCWFAPKDMKIGDRIRTRIDDSIWSHDKLLLVLSESSVSSQWIEQEVETALEKERNQRCDVLFPVRLDDYVMSIRSGWPALIKNTRHIGDFSQWKNLAEYNKAFFQLLDDLTVRTLKKV